MLLNRLALIPGLAAMLLLAAPALAATGMQPGLWELTMTVEVSGKLQTVPTSRECVSQSDVDHATKTLPRPEGACTLSNVLRSAERATYRIACTQGALTTRGNAEIVYAGDRYDGKVDLTVSERNTAGMVLAMTINAKRVGDCTK